MTEHVVAVFDTENAADAGARELENAGIQPRPSGGIGRTKEKERQRTLLLAERRKRHLQAAAFGLGCWVKSPLTPRGQPTRGMRNGMIGERMPGTRFLA